MRYAWLAVLAASLVPVAVAGFFANPLVFLLLGPEGWRERMLRLYPYRRWLLLSIAVCALASTVYGLRYGY